MNEKGYFTVDGYGEASFVEKRSEFIGYAKQVETEAEAIVFINEIRKKHSDATHNVYAYVTRKNNIQRYSDDGEPQGTAGIPVLDVIRKRGLTDTVIVVTRYFGGILLGGGGLVRAYGSAASSAVEAAGIAEYAVFAEFNVECDYSDYQKIQYDIFNNGIKIINSDFAEGVTLKLACLEAYYMETEKRFTELTQGRCKIAFDRISFDKK